MFIPNAMALTHPLVAAAPSVGLPVTICVLTYGSHDALAQRCLGSLYDNTNPSLFSLRIGLNEVGTPTRELCQNYAARFDNISLYAEPKNIYKAPMMRRLFNDPPLTSTWTIWCDDDTHFTRSDWLQRLSLKIESSPDVAMWGKHYVLWRHDQFIVDWIESAAWHKGKPCARGVDLQGRAGFHFVFLTGGFWAIRTELLRLLDWPDRRLLQANDDFLLCEALRQQNLPLGQFEHGVMINDSPRRNADDPAVEGCPGTQ